MTTSCHRRVRLAGTAPVIVLIAFASVLTAGALPAGSAEAPTAPSAGPAAAEGAEADALRNAIWELERHLRHRLDAHGPRRAGAAVQARRPIPLLAERLHALRRAAWELGDPVGAELARKAAALRPLLREVERSERAGVSGASGSTWRLADRTSATWVETAAHAACRDARGVGDGLFAANNAGPGSGGELWLRYTAPAGGFVVADTAGSGFDTVVEVYDACPSSGGARIAGGDDQTGLQARVAFRSVAGETRWLRFGGWEGAVGSLRVEIESGVVAGFAGVVTEEASGDPLSRDVEVWNAGGSFVTSVDTDSNGIYLVLGLAPGTYFASTQSFFSSDGLLDELYDDLPCPGGAPVGCNPAAGTAIVVPPDDVVTGIDFALEPGAVLTGRVRDAATGLPLQSVEVRVFDQSGDFIGEDGTDVAGRYLIDGLAGGTVFALADETFGSEYQSELYDDIPCPFSCDVTTGTPIATTVGQTTSGIDFDLDRMGAFEGTVTRAADGSPLPFANIDIWDDEGNNIDSTFTNGLGQYRAGGLTTGTYFATTFTFEFVDELYNDIPCFPSCDPTTGSPIPVTLGSTTGGIDFALNRLGGISGALTEAMTGDPIGADIVVFNASGSFVESESGFGSYRVGGLLPGVHYVVASGFEHLSELYDDLPCPGGAPSGCDPTTGTPVMVQLDADTPGIDFALTPLGAIAGTVTESGTGLPLGDFSINVWDTAGDFVTGDSFFSATGSYEIGGLDAGTYFVTVNPEEHAGELYDDLPCSFGSCDPTAGTPVAVSVGSTTAGIDFAVDLLGGISGTVRDATTALPIAFADVRVFHANGVPAAFGGANAAGEYRAGGLQTGTYFVRASEVGYSRQLYDGLPCPSGCDPTTGTPVPVTVGSETGGIDFDLARSATISGTVTSAVGGPLSSASVFVFDADGDFTESTGTDSAGRYTVEVDAGTWFLIADGFPDHVSQLYDGIPCPAGECDPSTGTPVPVAAGDAVSGIDFTLDPARGITGRATDGAGNPLPGVAIDFWDSGGDLLGTAVTSPQGRYLFSPGSGTYFVSTDNGLGALDEIWDDVPCPLGPAHQGQCDPTTGDPVVLPNFDSLVTDIDFVLSGVTIFEDGFESGDTSAWSATVE